MFKLFGLIIATEAQVQELLSNNTKTAANMAMSQVDTSKPLTEYERGRRDAASDIELLV